MLICSEAAIIPTYNPKKNEFYLSYLLTEIKFFFPLLVKALLHSSSDPLIANCTKFSFFNLSNSFFCFFCSSYIKLKHLNVNITDI